MSFPDRLLPGAADSLNLHLFIQAIITMMRGTGVSTPCDLRGDFSYCSSQMICQILSMNFNALRAIVALA